MRTKITREIANEEAKEIICSVQYEQRSYEHDFDEEVFDVKINERFVVRETHYAKAAFMCNTLNEQRIVDYVAHKIIVGEDVDFFRNVKVTIK